MSEGGISVLCQPSPRPAAPNSTSSLKPSLSPSPSPPALGCYRLESPCPHELQRKERKKPELPPSNNNNPLIIYCVDAIRDHNSSVPAAAPMAASSYGHSSSDSERQKKMITNKKSGGGGGAAGGGCRSDHSAGGAHGNQATAPAAAAPLVDDMNGYGGCQCPRKRLARHRLKVAGNVEIPDAWCGNGRLVEWAASEDVEAALRPPDLFQARAALVSHAASRIGTGAGAATGTQVPLET